MNMDGSREVTRTGDFGSGTTGGELLCGAPDELLVYELNGIIR